MINVDATINHSVVLVVVVVAHLSKCSLVQEVQCRTNRVLGTSLSCCGQSYKASMIVNYDSRVIPDLKIPHIPTLES